ncbi:fibronectin type III domain-containing protein [Galbitalea sp. SE-J8]|uniref:fibronectin type III domain-containing protein n=1 Tax=Galbitalea sp. SE-J8 TaxID=3054952 RepID=UPI00259CBDFC|nr:fibronectin type III domain-containing protein [Galbitalea sp. SE-J8]MDM4761733.1 fibronectin type III domain-containing protein [Galbitalea sp. SE-J8]
MSSTVIATGSYPVTELLRARRRARRRRTILILAMATTVAGAGLFVAENSTEMAAGIERIAWSFSPAASVTHLDATGEYDGIDLSWAPEDRAATYSVTVATDPGLEHAIARLRTGTPHVVLSGGLAEGTTYFYRVSWVSALGNAGAATAIEPVTTAFHDVVAPSGVVVAPTASSFTVTWQPVEFATGYVVRMSTSADPTTFGTNPGDVEFPETTATTLTTDAVDASLGQRRYFTVRAANLGLSSATAAPVGARMLIPAPANPAAVGASTSGVTLTWSAVAGARRYVVERSATADFATVDGAYPVPDAYQRTSVNGLAPGTPYFFRIRAESGKHLGENSAVVTATTLSSGSIDARVATYNVLDPTLGTSLGSWSVRRKNLASTIDDAGADIVALQEAGWSRVAGGKTPAQDLKGLIDKRMKLSKAGYRGDAILYSPAKYTAGSHGVIPLPRISGDGQRVAIWQVLRDKKTKTAFIVLSTHLTAGIQNNAGRVRQAKTILARLPSINKHGLPVVLMGDLNSYDARAAVTPMSLFAAAGLVDAELSTPATDTPTLNTWVKATSPTGSVRFDHIAVSSSVGVNRTEIENPKLTGPASDHRLLWADVSIPTA